MREKLYKRLRKGLVLDLFIDTDSGRRYEHTVQLIEELANWRDPLPFQFSENSDENAVKKKWRVKIVKGSPLDIGRELVRFIPQFHSKGVVQINGEEE